MKKIRKWRGRIVFCGLLALIFASIAFEIHRLPLNIKSGCVTQQQTVSKNSRGDEVQMSDELCDGMANSARTTLMLTMKGTKTSEPFFIYDIDASNNPTFEWMNNNTLLVHIEGEGPIYKQLDHVADVKIRYTS